MSMTGDGVKEREWGKDKVGEVSQGYVMPSHIGQGKCFLFSLKYKKSQQPNIIS